MTAYCPYGTDHVFSRYTGFFLGACEGAILPVRIFFYGVYSRDLD